MNGEITIFTIHETKRTQLGTFKRRILCIQLENNILRVTPCVRPECPDLGFQVVIPENLQGDNFKERQDNVTLSDTCLNDLIERLKTKTEEETSSDLSKKHFDEVAMVTELEKYRLPFRNLLKED